MCKSTFSIQSSSAQSSITSNRRAEPESSFTQLVRRVVGAALLVLGLYMYYKKQKQKAVPMIFFGAILRPWNSNYKFEPVKIDWSSSKRQDAGSVHDTSHRTFNVSVGGWGNQQSLLPPDPSAYEPLSTTNDSGSGQNAKGVHDTSHIPFNAVAGPDPHSPSRPIEQDDRSSYAHPTSGIPFNASSE